MPEPIDDEGDPERRSHWHDKHCFDYLWQTLLCHADVTVMTVGWNEKQQAFNANFAVTKQCRNFEAIHNWAKNREAKFKPPGDVHPGRIETWPSLRTCPFLRRVAGIGSKGHTGFYLCSI